MADLYTSLTRAKQELNDGVLPPMTPVPSDHEVIDPAYTIGMGALEECAERGLRCPIRGCGKFYKNLASHLVGKIHNDVLGGKGGRDYPVLVFRKELGLSHNTPLLSRELRRRMSANAAVPSPNGLRAMQRARKERRTTRRLIRKSPADIEPRNKGNSCDAQLCHRVLTIRDRLGRLPLIRDAEEYDHGLYGAVIALGFEWQSFISYVCLLTGLEVERDREHALTVLKAWHTIHGRIPELDELRYQDVCPPLPTDKILSRALGKTSWEGKRGARRVAVMALGVTDIRGGIHSWENFMETDA